VGLVLAMAIAALGSLSLSHERLVLVMKAAIANDDFVSDENFTECSLVQMQFSRHPALADDILRSVWMFPLQMQRDHPCNTLAHINAGQTAELPPAIDYLNYPFGARFLLAAELSLVSFHGARVATQILS
jgi:hypothetical protein